jgi:DNA adenine methylase
MEQLQLPLQKRRGRKRGGAAGGPRPFLKWAGGKRQLLVELRQHVPEKINTYHEPMVGGGALFFAIKPRKAVLSDSNERLVRTYRGVRDAVEDVIGLLSGYPHSKPFFLDLRAREIDSGTDAEVAAWMIYLNKTCFNGLYRVNSKDRFNVPFGHYKDPLICDAELLRACSTTLRSVKIEHEDFKAVGSRARPGDFVYFDPPYVPVSTTASFTSYTKGGFGVDDQRRLRDVAGKLKRKGAHVLLSNSSTPLVHQLYGEGFEHREVLAKRAINSKGSARGPVGELIIW